MRIARFALATLAFCVFATFFVAVGNNVGVNGVFDWGTFGGSFFGIFGGVGSFIALLGVVVVLAMAFFAIYRLALMNRNGAAAGVGLLFIILAAIIGVNWVNWSFLEGAWMILIYLLVAAVATVLIGAILGSIPLRRRTSTIRSTTTV